MEKEKEVAFGLGQIGKETPLWAKNIFRIWFFSSKAIIGWMSATKLIPPAILFEVTQAVVLLVDPIVFGFSKMFGVVPEEDEK